MKRRGADVKRAFTVIELLVVIAVISLLMSLLMPALRSARAQGKQIVCGSNIRQLVLANIGYAGDNHGSYAPAALDGYGGGENNHRWHGVRDDKNMPFDPLRSPLAAYLADGSVKKCPLKVNFRHGEPWEWDFEDGCGGYGYNMTYIGSRIWSDGYSRRGYEETAKDFEVRRPVQTLMFADTAMAKLDGGRPYYLEYSFSEPPFFVVNGEPVTLWGYASPSIHFRHRGSANIGWADGHISSEKIVPFEEENIYGVKSSDMLLGWFEPIDNTPFDLK